MNPDLRRALLASLNAREFPLTLMGPTGTGKSVAAAILFRITAEKPEKPIWWDAQEILSLIVEARNNGKGYVELANGAEFWPRKFMHQVEACNLLVLDDLGTKALTDSQRVALLNIFDARLDRPMIVTCNHSPDALAELTDDRTVSRLMAGRMIQVNGKDRRLNRKILSVGGA